MAGYALDKIYRQGYEYQKAGIMLFDIMPDHFQQLCLFQSEKYNEVTRKRMKLLDFVNSKYGSQTLRFAAESKKRWYMHQEHLSPAYTTNWEDLLSVS